MPCAWQALNKHLLSWISYSSEGKYSLQCGWGCMLTGHWKHPWQHIQKGEVNEMSARCWGKTCSCPESRGDGVSTVDPYGKIPLQYCQGQWKLRLLEMYTLITFIEFLGLWFCFDRFPLRRFKETSSSEKTVLLHPPTFIPSLGFLSFSKGAFRKHKSNG